MAPKLLSLCSSNPMAMAAQEARAHERTKARADQTLLAKEIKRLREELALQVWVVLGCGLHVPMLRGRGGE